MIKNDGEVLSSDILNEMLENGYAKIIDGYIDYYITVDGDVISTKNIKTWGVRKLKTYLDSVGYKMALSQQKAIKNNMMEKGKAIGITINKSTKVFEDATDKSNPA